MIAETPSLLIAASGSIVLILGIIHILYTYTTTKLHPRDASLQKAMAAVPLVISKQTTTWKTWIGFNASHSLGAIFFGLIYIYLSIHAPLLLFNSLFLQGLGLSTLACYVWVAATYWFKSPHLGLCIATGLFSVGVLVAQFK